MKIERIDQELLSATLARAEDSPRRRANHNFHPSLEDNPHRFLNAMLRGTYVTPHRHVAPPKSETFVILEGEVAFLVFDDDGELTQVEWLGARGTGRSLGIDIGPGVWHSLVVISERAVCFEVKPGPYAVSSDKDFAPWAPREGGPEAAAYLEALVARAGLPPSAAHR